MIGGCGCDPVVAHCFVFAETLRAGYGLLLVYLSCGFCLVVPSEPHVVDPCAESGAQSERTKHLMLVAMQANNSCMSTLGRLR